MLRSARPVFVALAVLALGGAQAQAQAPAYDFAVSPDPPNVNQAATFTFVGSTEELEEEDIRWDLDGDGTYDDGQGTVVGWTYPSAGTVSVGMSVTPDDEEEEPPVIKPVTINGGPTADFGFTPSSPVAGEGVAFSAQGNDPEGDALFFSWDFGDGGSATGASPTHSFAEEGTYDVVLTVTDEHGAFATRNVSVAVAEDTGPIADFTIAPARPRPDETPTSRQLVWMRPFPVVRIAGVVLRNGAIVRVLSVRAPRGARVRVRCLGQGCPTGSVARTSATGLLRFGRFERHLRAGIKLEIFVRKAGRVGKYTRFLIRAGKPPARVDRCLIPGRLRPIGCQ